MLPARNDDLETIGGRIRAMRIERKMSQSALARRTDCSPTDVWRWEVAGRIPSVDKLILISAALQVSIDYLLGCTRDPRTIEQFKADLIRHVSS